MSEADRRVGRRFPDDFPHHFKDHRRYYQCDHGTYYRPYKIQRRKGTAVAVFVAFLMPVTGILLFTVPRASETVQVIWIMVSYNLFYSIAYTIYNMSHTLMVPLSTRNTTERGGLSVFNNIASVMMSGIIVALVFPMVVMPALESTEIYGF